MRQVGLQLLPDVRPMALPLLGWFTALVGGRGNGGVDEGAAGSAPGDADAQVHLVYAEQGVSLLSYVEHMKSCGDTVTTAQVVRPSARSVRIGLDKGKDAGTTAQVTGRCEGHTEL